MAATNFSQSRGELRIQDGGAHESRPCWKTTHQPQRRTGIGLTDFHGDTNHTRVFAKMSRNFEIHVTNFDKYDFVFGEKMAYWTRRPGISLFIFFPSHSRINLHTCKSNEKQLYLFKKSFTRGTCVHSLSGRTPIHC